MSSKVQLATAYDWCNAQVLRIQHQIAIHDYFVAIDICVSSLGNVHDSITYQRRYLYATAPTTTIIDQLLWYAPCFFRNNPIDQVELFYKNGTKAERDALPEMPRKLDVARNLSKRCVALWQLMSDTPDALASPDLTCELDSPVLRQWYNAGLIYVVPAQPRVGYAKITDFDRIATGKCFKCGAVRRATTAVLAEHAACTACHRMTDFAILNRRSEG